MMKTHMQRITGFGCLLTVLMLTVLPALSQELPAAKPAAGDAISDEDLTRILNDLSPEDIDALVKMAAGKQLAAERRQTVAEIRSDILYEDDPVAVKKAVALLEAAGEGTQADNITRICKAFALVDPTFAKPYNAFLDKKYAEAAAMLKKSLNPEEATCLSAAMHYVYAESLRNDKKDWAAVQAYSDLLVNLPERISFASASALQAAKLYEQMGRGLYAMEMYIYCLQNYSLTMSNAAAAEIVDKVEALQKKYKDPMGTVADLLKDVKTRLDSQKFGQDTQQKQTEVVNLLEDLIQTAEEKQRQQQQQQQPQRQRQQRQKEQEGKGKGKGKGKGEGEAKAQGQQSRPGMTDNPTQGAKSSALVPGPVSQPNKLAQRHNGKDSGKWSDMPPRQQEQIRSLMRQRLSKRRGGLVSDYHKKLATEE